MGESARGEDGYDPSSMENNFLSRSFFFESFFDFYPGFLIPSPLHSVFNTCPFLTTRIFNGDSAQVPTHYVGKRVGAPSPPTVITARHLLQNRRGIIPAGTE